MSTSTQPLDTRLRRLRLGYMASAVEAQNADSLHEKHSYLEFLDALVDGEIGARENKGLRYSNYRAESGKVALALSAG